jgi:hypothetical protein
MQTVPTQEVQIAAPFSLSSGAKANFLRRLCAALFNPVDISFLVFFRILVTFTPLLFGKILPEEQDQVRLRSHLHRLMRF